MGPVNWMVVVLAALAAAAVLWLFWRGRLPVWGYGLALIPAAMLGHALARIGADKLAAKPFAHLPVLGVPGWWPANDEPSFYADPGVFRPLRNPAVAAM